MSHYVGTQAQCNAVGVICNKLRGYPLRDGVHVGGGRHVDIHQTVPGPGWTTAYAAVRKHPTLDTYAIPLGDDIVSERALRGGRLTAGERTQFDAAASARTDLDDTWKESPP